MEQCPPKFKSTIDSLYVIYQRMMALTDKIAAATLSPAHAKETVINYVRNDPTAKEFSLMMKYMDLLKMFMHQSGWTVIDGADTQLPDGTWAVVTTPDGDEIELLDISYKLKPTDVKN